MVVIVDILANSVWVGYLFYAFKASFNYYQKLLVSHHIYYIKLNLAYTFMFIESLYTIIHSSSHQIDYIMATYIINNPVIFTLIYNHYIDILYIQPFNYQFNKTLMKILINYLT